jgi:hypothetical protein
MVSSLRHNLPLPLITIFVVLQDTASLADAAYHPTLPSLRLRNPVLWLCSTCPALSSWRGRLHLPPIHRDLASLSIRKAQRG